MRLEPARVERCEFDSVGELLLLARRTKRALQQLRSKWLSQQPSRGLLQGREVWHALQIDGPAQIAALGEHPRDATVIGPQKLLQDKAGKQLMLRELFRAEAMRVAGNRLFRNLQRHPQHRRRRFAGRSHTPYTDACTTTV